MLLHLEDERLTVRLRGLADGRHRLVIDYPAEPRYRETVFTALSELLKPGSDPGTSRAKLPATRGDQ